MVLAENLDEHVTGGLFKIYLRELPNPLVPYSYYSAFTACKQSVEQFREVISSLPIVNQYLLRLSLCVFHHISLKSKHTIR